MDAPRFDAFARAAARCTTRRQVLRVVAAGVLASWRPWTAPIAALGKFACAEGEIDCGRGCVDPQTSNLHCGVCGNSCELGVTCEGGACVPVVIECPDGEPPCGEVCADKQTDPFNCGACGNVCASAVCDGGACTPGGCGEGVPSCDGVCTDLITDPLNCGACGVACGDGENCVRGGCTSIPYDLCDDGCPICAECSEGVCVTSANDTGCRTADGGSGACVNGECAPGGCGDGLTLCGGFCVDLQTDFGNCGACGNTCQAGGDDPSNESCVNGVCTAQGGLCPDGSTPYYGAERATDPFNCGPCGIVCGDDESCSGGVCVPTASACDAGLTECGGRCVNLGSDEANCGSCGFVCALNASCRNGECLCPDDWGYCEAVGACYDFATDPDNCGDCGVACGAGEVCDDGACGKARPRPTPTRTASKPALAWPFDPKDGTWTIVNGYRGTGQHAATVDGEPNPARFALDFARCAEEAVDEARGICGTGGRGGLFGQEGGELGWDRAATRGATVLAPVDGTVAYDGELTPTCRYVGIDVADHPGYQVLLVNVEGAPTEGAVKQGKPIGKVATGSCGEGDDGDYLLMLLFRRTDGEESDPDAKPEGVPFAGDWEIDGCAYPDDKRTANQYLGELVPCQPPSTGQSRANA